MKKSQTTNILFVVILSAILSGSTRAHINMCLNRDIPGLEVGRLLINRTLYSYASTGLIDCLRYCKLHMSCLSVNFDITSSMCEINLDHTGSLVPDINYRHWEADVIPPTILGGCNGHQCLENERCEPREDGSAYSCVTVLCIGANIPPVSNVKESSFTKKDLWGLNATVTYPCKDGFRPSKNAVCQENGNWTDFSCLPIQTCKDIQLCGVYDSNEYWLELYPGFRKLKVFCHLGPSKAGHYITLLELNKSVTSPDTRESNDSCQYITQTAPYSNDSMGETHFQKIFLYRPDDYLLGSRGDFHNSTGTKQRFGYAGDCFSIGDSCDSRGTFIVNLEGTGFRIKDTVKWKTTGNLGKIDYIIRSPDGWKVEGRCGGYCGGCVSKTKIYVEQDPNYVYPNHVAAVTPSCPSLFTS